VIYAGATLRLPDNVHLKGVETESPSLDVLEGLKNSFLGDAARSASQTPDIKFPEPLLAQLKPVASFFPCPG